MVDLDRLVSKKEKVIGTVVSSGRTVVDFKFVRKPTFTAALSVDNKFECLSISRQASAIRCACEAELKYQISASTVIKVADTSLKTGFTIKFKKCSFCKEEWKLIELYIRKALILMCFQMGTEEQDSQSINDIYKYYTNICSEIANMEGTLEYAN